MTSKRNLGPPLALAGLGVVVVAVVAGFVAVGGPGDARDRRLDDMTLSQVANVAAAAQCGFALDGTVPADMAGLRAAIDRAAQRGVTADKGCDIYGGTPLPDDVEYSRLADDRIRACASFRRPYDPEDQQPRRYGGPLPGRFPELSAPRPAGRHCYEIQLVKPAPLPLK
jgi:hypothetical protein